MMLSEFQPDNLFGGLMPKKRKLKKRSKRDMLIAYDILSVVFGDLALHFYRKKFELEGKAKKPKVSETTKE